MFGLWISTILRGLTGLTIRRLAVRCLGTTLLPKLLAGYGDIATGGLTRLYARNSASANMSGDGYALALRGANTAVARPNVPSAM